MKGKPLILDNGAFEIKAGFAGSQPRYGTLTILNTSKESLINGDTVSCPIALPVQREIDESMSAYNSAIAKTTDPSPSRGHSIEYNPIISVLCFLMKRDT
jgi:actin-related protein